MVSGNVMEVEDDALINGIKITFCFVNAIFCSS